MIEKLSFRSFKSIESLEFEPSTVNILIGANGSGKSNVLEAIGVLSAAAGGRVDDESLLRRGVRPGLPSLYKCAFSGIGRTPHISFGAWSRHASYEVSLSNPIHDPLPEWRYHTEKLIENGDSVIDRPDNGKDKYNPEAGLAALSLVELDAAKPAATFLRTLRDFAIYSPDTNTLRGITPDMRQRKPVGLNGGHLAAALSDLLKGKDRNSDPFAQKVQQEVLPLIDWAKSYGTATPTEIPLSSSVGSTQRVIRFTDRYMQPNRNVLSGYDASEGALFILFHAVLAAHPKSPVISAVDNADHALNPRLARALLSNICEWYLDSPRPRQIFLTTHNPLALDGIPLQNDRVRLFTVSRTDKGHTVVQRVVLDEKLQKMADKGWTLSRLWVMGHLGGVANV
jgi:energy-coupling factor transporter ATP-binding protein EcfA2